MKLKELDHHCGVLCELIIKGTEYFIDRVEWKQPLINLKIASGLKSLDYDATRFDDSIGWCGLADIMTDHQEALERKLVLELCRFHFIWSSLEAAMDVAVPLRFLTKPLGKVNKTCSFIAKLGFNTPPLAARKTEKTLDRYPVRLRRGVSLNQRQILGLSSIHI